MCIIYNDKRCKVVIDKEKAMHVISSYKVTRAYLKVNPHPNHALSY